MYRLLCDVTFFGLLVLLAVTSVSIRADDTSPGDAPRLRARESIWTDIGPNERLPVLNLLAAHTRGNYERIKTWHCVYAVESETWLNPAFVKSAFSNRLPKGATPTLIDASEYTLTLNIDQKSGAVFRDREFKRFRLLTTDSRKAVTIPGVHANDLRSVVTSKDYIFFKPKDPPATPMVCKDWPEGKQKRAAQRASGEVARDQHHGELPDPREFYRSYSSDKSWEQLGRYIAALEGRLGEQTMKKMSDVLKIGTATRGAAKLYRLQVPLEAGNGQVITVMSVWDSAAGFNPVEVTFSEKLNGADVVTNLIASNWKAVDGIFVPAVVHERWHPAKMGIDTFKRNMTMKECKLNQPFDPDHFTYKALGLKSGDLILDDLERTVFILRDDKPERLAAYNEPYIETRAEEKLRAEAPARSSAWRWLLAANIVALLLIVAFVIGRKLMQR